MERDFIKKLSDEITKISTHTLTWSVTIVHKLKITVENNFNSHAHVERDALLKFSLCQIIGISTHTLTWSVTLKTSDTMPLSFISTHTLTWSVTSGGGSSSNVNRISTHTLTWSVTVVYNYIRFVEPDFNSHAHVERDLILSIISLMQVLFQLTRSRGA